MSKLRQGWLAVLLLLICPIIVRVDLAAEPMPPTATTTLNQLIEANQQSHQQLRNVRMQYDIEGRLVEEGKSRVVSQSQGHIFCTADNHKRLRLKLVNLDGQRTTTDRYFADGLMHEQTYSQAFDPIGRPITPKSQRSFRGSITPGKQETLDRLIPPILDRIVFMSASSPLSLYELLQQWDCQILNDTPEEVTLRAEIPQGHSKEHAGSYVVLKIRRDRGYHVQEAKIVETNAGTRVDTNESVDVFFTFQVIEWQEPKPGIWFPKKVRFGNHGAIETANQEHGYFVEWTVTSLTINDDAMPSWLGFEFPTNALVVEDRKDGNAKQFLLWGADGKREKIEPEAVGYQLEKEDEVYCVPTLLGF